MNTQVPQRPPVFITCTRCNAVVRAVDNYSMRVNPANRHQSVCVQCPDCRAQKRRAYRRNVTIREGQGREERIEIQREQRQRRAILRTERQRNTELREEIERQQNEMLRMERLRNNELRREIKRQQALNQKEKFNYVPLFLVILFFMFPYLIPKGIFEYIS